MKKQTVRKAHSDARETLIPKIADILTITKEQADDLLRTVDDEEIEALTEAMTSRVQKIAADLYQEQFALSDEDVRDEKLGVRNWIQNSLARLPVQNWVEADGVGRVIPPKEASLKYINPTAPDEKELRSVQKQLNNRTALYKALIEILPENVHAEYAPILKLEKIEVAEDAHPNLTDVSLAITIQGIECLYYSEYAKREQAFRRIKNIPIDAPTPYNGMSWLAVRAHHYANIHLHIWDINRVRDAADVEEMQVPKPASGEPDSPETNVNAEIRQKPKWELTLELVCNIAANRVLQETGKIGDLAMRATAVSVQMLDALNRLGINEVPAVANEQDILDTLTQWFGPNGLVVNESGFGTPLGNQDMEVVKYHSEHVQIHYLKTRGANAPFAHDKIENRFIFALAMVAVVYAKIQLEKEFVGSTNPTYAAFPAQNKRDGLNSRLKALPAHSRELIKSLYGQIFFSNTEWNILHDDVQVYADGMTDKRNVLQTLIFELFKRSAPKELLKLHNIFESMAEEWETDFYAHPDTHLLPEPGRINFVCSAVAAMVNAESNEFSVP
ncbi:hypothetical protein [Paraburkholderia sp. RL17-347-BIC-D]|uniref:hypothetical protein n=1 Tax=Paraburkholderia sp. RL17-347-BIC-D TaxID=3031632 RepID=UPI0038BC655F